MRYAEYLRRLRDVARAHGVAVVPFLVNLHGTDRGRGQTFPIGISQLSQSYAGVPQMTAKSDNYLGEPDRRERARPLPDEHSWRR